MATKSPTERVDVNAFLDEIAAEISVNKPIPVKYNLFFCTHDNVSNEIIDIEYTTRNPDKVRSNIITKNSSYVDSDEIYYFVSTDDVANSEYVPLVNDDSIFDAETKKKITDHNHFIKIVSVSGNYVYCITRRGKCADYNRNNYIIKFRPRKKQKWQGERFFIKLSMRDHGIINASHIVDASIMICGDVAYKQSIQKQSEFNYFDREREHINEEYDKLWDAKRKFDKKKTCSTKPGRSY